MSRNTIPARTGEDFLEAEESGKRVNIAREQDKDPDSLPPCSIPQVQPWKGFNLQLNLWDSGMETPGNGPRRKDMAM